MQGPGLRVEALGVAGAPSPNRLTTSFHLAEGVLVDAGAAAHAIEPEARRGIRHLLLSHAHLDHTLGLPFLLADCEPCIYGLQETLDSVRDCLLDGRIWPDLRQRANWKEVRPGQSLHIDELEVVIGASNHTVPCLSFAVRANGRTVVLVGDTRVDSEVIAWAAGLVPTVCVVEVSYPDAYCEVAERFGHQTARDLEAWRNALGDECRLCVTHIKPTHDDAVRAECEALKDPRLEILRDGDVIEA
ncbi:MAG: MBL fold metallo-hydrolase [Planctomycetota bacterium]